MKFVIILISLSLILYLQPIPNVFASPLDELYFDGSYSFVVKEGSIFAILNFETTNNGNTTYDLSKLTINIANRIYKNKKISFLVGTQNKAFWLEFNPFCRISTRN